MFLEMEELTFPPLASMIFLNSGRGLVRVPVMTKVFPAIGESMACCCVGMGAWLSEVGLMPISVREARVIFPASELKKSMVFCADAGPSSELIWYSVRDFFVLAIWSLSSLYWFWRVSFSVSVFGGLVLFLGEMWRCCCSSLAMSAMLGRMLDLEISSMD